MTITYGDLLPGDLVIFFDAVDDIVGKNAPQIVLRLVIHTEQSGADVSLTCLDATPWSHRQSPTFRSWSHRHSERLFIYGRDVKLVHCGAQ